MMHRSLGLLILTGLLATPAAADEELRKLTATAHHEAETAAFDLDRIDDQIGGLPPGPRRTDMQRQRALLEAQLRRELESVVRLAKKIDELERKVVMEAHHGMKMPGPPIKAHPAGPEPVVPDLPSAEPAEEGGSLIKAPVGPIVPVPAD